MSATTTKLYGFSVYFLPQDGLGERMEGTPMTVREFTVTEDRGDSLVLNDQWPVKKKGMKVCLGDFEVPLHRSLETARGSMRTKLGL